MNTLFLVGFLAIFGMAQAQDSEITQAMKQFNIIPDVVLDGAVATLNVTFDSGVIADMGNELTPTQVKNEPTLDWDADEDTFYTLIMTDPDAKDSQGNSCAEYVPWFMVNIPGKFVDAGQIISEYVAVGPPNCNSYLAECSRFFN